MTFYRGPLGRELESLPVGRFITEILRRVEEQILKNGFVAFDHVNVINQDVQFQSISNRTLASLLISMVPLFSKFSFYVCESLMREVTQDRFDAIDYIGNVNPDFTSVGDGLQPWKVLSVRRLLGLRNSAASTERRSKNVKRRALQVIIICTST